MAETAIERKLQGLQGNSTAADSCRLQQRSCFVTAAIRTANILIADYKRMAATSVDVLTAQAVRREKSKHDTEDVN